MLNGFTQLGFPEHSRTNTKHTLTLFYSLTLNLALWLLPQTQAPARRHERGWRGDGWRGTDWVKKGENSHRWSPKMNNNVKHIPGNLSVTASGPASVITDFDDSAEMENTWQKSMSGLNLLSHDFLPVMKPDIFRGSCPSVATAISSWPRDSQKSSRLFRSIRTSAKSGSCTQ